MKNPDNTRAPSFDAEAIQATIQRALASAGLDTSSGPMREVTETIRRALSPGTMDETRPNTGGDTVIDVEARHVVEREDSGAPTGPTRQGGGQFEPFRFSSAVGSRNYKLYVPFAASDAARPIVVMLHGCTQSPDDFAAGTQMNRLADEHGFLVVYPEQDAQANASKCWNWFQPQDQRRGAGEPALIAGIVGEVVRSHGADPQRVFVAGLSAGAAMAVVLGETYPELFSGVGVHSGLPYGSATDIPSALAAMKGGRSGMPGLKNLPVAAEAPRATAVQAVPLIVFHGDRDHTVQPVNGAHIVQQALDAHAAEWGEGRLSVSTERGQAPGGRRFSRTVHADAQGQPRIESWTVHGAGHAWSGGHASGSFTDGKGPDASAEMLRFFMALPVAGSAQASDSGPDPGQAP